jgi:hypothetical protein
VSRREQRRWLRQKAAGFLFSFLNEEEEESCNISAACPCLVMEEEDEASYILSSSI